MAANTVKKKLEVAIVTQADLKGVHDTQKGLDQVADSAGKTSAASKILDGALTAIGFNVVDIGAKLGGMAVGFGKDSINAAKDFQQSLANVSSTVKLADGDMEKLHDTALTIGKDTSKSANEAVDAFGELLKAGRSVDDVVGGLGKTVVQLSEATGDSVANMATLLSNAMNTFGIAAKDGEKTADTLARAANASAIDVSDLGQSLQAVGPVAAQAGITMDQFSTAIGIFGNHALKGSDAGTSFKTMVMALTAPTDKAAGLMETLGIKVFDAQGKTRDFRAILGDLETAFKDLSDEDRSKAMKDIFGTDAIRAANILLQEGTAGWDKFVDEMGKAPSVADMSKAKLATLSGAMEQFRGSVETLQIQLGEKLLPALTKIATVGVTALNWLLDGTVVNSIGKVATAFRDILPDSTVSAMTSRFTGIITSVRDGVEDILDGLGRFVAYVRDHWAVIWDEIGPVVKAAVSFVADDIKNAIGLISGSLDVIFGLLTLNWRQAWDGVTTIVDSAVGLVLDKVTNLKDLAVALFGLFKDGAVAAVQGIWTFVSEELPTWPEKIRGWLAEWAPKAKAEIQHVYDEVTGGLGRVWDWVKTELPTWPGKLGGFLAPAADAVCDVFHNAASAMRNWLAAAWDWMAAELPQLPGQIVSALGNLAEAFCSIAKNMASGFVDALRSLPSGIARALDAAAKPIGAFIDMVNVVLDKLGAPKLPTLGGVTSPGDAGGSSPTATVAGVGGKMTTAGPLAAIKCYADGGIIAGLTAAVMGEDGPGYPEYVIPTHPRARGRAMGLLQQAAASILPANAGGLGDLIGGIWSSVTDLISQGAEKVVQRLVREAGVDLSGMSGLGGDIARGAWKAIYDGISKMIAGLFAKHATPNPGDWLRPVQGYSVTQEFGQNPDVYGPGGHPGIDLAVPMGTRVGASAGGSTAFTGWLDPRGTGGYGNAVIVQHLQGLTTLYGHLSSIITNLGQTVMGGDPLGLSGSTGFSTGPHLHFEVRRGGVAVNPREYVRFGNGGIVSQKYYLVDPETGEIVGEVGESGPEAIIPIRNDDTKPGGLNPQGKDGKFVKFVPIGSLGGEAMGMGLGEGFGPGKFVVIPADSLVNTEGWPLSAAGEGRSPGKFFNPGRLNTEGWTTVGGEGRGAVDSVTIEAGDIAITASNGSTVTLTAADVSATTASASESTTSGSGERGISWSKTLNAGGLFGLIRDVLSADGATFTLYNASEALRRATGGRSGEEIFADMAHMADGAKQAWQAAINLAAMFQNTALNPASLTYGMTPDEVNTWVTEQRAAEGAAALAKKAAEEAAKNKDKAGEQQTQAATTQQSAASQQQQAAATQAQVADQQEATAQLEEDRAIVAADHADKAARDATAASETHQAAAGIMKDAADSDTTAASDFVDAAQTFGVQVSSFAEAVDTMSAASEAAANAYLGGADESKKPTPGQSGSGNDAPPALPPEQNAFGGFISRHTLLMDAATGHIYGSVAEPGTGGEWIMNRNQMAAWASGWGGGDALPQGDHYNQVFMMPPDADAYRREMQTWQFQQRVQMSSRRFG